MEQVSYFPTQLAFDIWKKKYAGDYKNPVDYFKDLATRVSLGSPAYQERFVDILTDGRFSPGGRILAWAGRPSANLSLMNCTTHAIDGDDLDAIAESMRIIMRASSHGQGIGVDLSKLRPHEAPVHNAAKTSTGAISFMELLNHVGGTIGQNGRRAALLFSMLDSHPDLWRESKDVTCPKCGGTGCFKCRGKGGFSYDFLNVKKIPGRVENANISVMITDAFMEAVKADTPWKLQFTGTSGGNSFHVEREVPARELFRALAEGGWMSAEPGVLFWDTSKRMSNSDLFGKQYEIAGVNACVRGDTLVMTEQGELTIEDLSKMENPPHILTLNEKTGELEYDDPLWINKTREDATVITLELEDGTELTLTPDHRVLTENRGWVAAAQLTEDDLILTVPNKGIRIKRITVAENTDTYDIGMTNNHNFVANGVVVHNCSEQVLDQDGVCNLGSLNLARYVTNPFTKSAKFNYKELAWDTVTAIQFLDNVLTIELDDERSITERQRESIIALRRIGLGVMGLADALAMLGLKYEANEDTAAAVHAIFRTIRDAAYDKSVQLARVYGPCGVFANTTKEQRKEIVEQGFYATLPLILKRDIINYGLRNALLLSIAPTGSISNLVGVSSGIEPIFAKSYTRVVQISGESQVVEVVHPGVELSRSLGVSDDVWQTAYEVSPTDHVKIQGIVQKYVDAAVSKTVNLPMGATVDDVENVYLMAWEEGLKGLTVYRDGSRDEQILTSNDRANGEDNSDTCPTCEAKLVHQDGCTSCPACGYSKC